MNSSLLLARLDKAIQRNADEQIAFLQHLVQTPSANPFTPEKSVPDTPIEREIAQLVFDKLRSLGLRPEMKGVSLQRPNVIASISGVDNEGRTLILNGHMDTVMPSEQWRFAPFIGAIQGNRLYGLGALDMKASLSVFVFATKAITDCEINLKGNLALTFVVDEEPGACSPFGTYYLLANGLRGTAAIVGEPGNTNVTIGHKGGYRFKLTVYGQATHTGFSSWERRKRGRNAIADMASVIQALQDIEIPFQPSQAFARRKPVFTFPTLIEGGTSINTVPDKCIAYGDCRLLPDNSDAQIRQLIHKRLNALPDLSYSLDDILYVPSVVLSKDEEIVQILVRHTTEILGKKPTTAGVGPWNDGWMFIANGIPAVCGFGPEGKGIHAPDEFVYIDSVLETTRIYVRAIVDYLGAASDQP